ncbi:MAG: hypothetical protein M3466_00735, partial [Gemmatimonadota bacterium]|nr:hypothetical protein [Gemmatimonadota bacterium]
QGTRDKGQGTRDKGQKTPEMGGLLTPSPAYYFSLLPLSLLSCAMLPSAHTASCYARSLLLLLSSTKLIAPPAHCYARSLPGLLTA